MLTVQLLRALLLSCCLAMVAPLIGVGQLLRDHASSARDTTGRGPYVVVLGVAQDAGYPHTGCKRQCCQRAWADESLGRLVTCLALIDPRTSQRWLFECTPDFPEQLHRLDQRYSVDDSPGFAGIFVTHAHIGHYTGLMYLGRESLGSRGVPVYAMPRMREFLAAHGPWSQLVALRNIVVRPLTADQSVSLADDLQVTPFVVPHRDEFSETVGFVISGPDRRIVFLPDIDKWDRWTRKIESLIDESDVALLDGTFYAAGEIPGRDMSSIPHPFITESIRRFSSLSTEARAKVYFIHFNHTNPVLDPEGGAAKAVRTAGHALAEQGMILPL